MASMTWWLIWEIVPSSCGTGAGGLKMVESGAASDVRMGAGTGGEGCVPSRSKGSPSGVEVGITSLCLTSGIISPSSDARPDSSGVPPPISAKSGLTCTVSISSLTAP